MNIFDKLNTPQVVIAILVVIVAVNGFLLFQQRNSQDSASTDTASNEPPTSESTSTEEGSGNGASGNGASGEETSSSQETPVQEATEESASSAPEETAQAEENPEAQQGNDDGDQDPVSEPSGPEEQEGSDRQQSPPPEDDGNDEPEPLLAGLSVELEDCSGSTSECVREYFADNVPDSRFLGGRVDLSAEPENANDEILYFESPGLGVCEFERERYVSGEGQDYTVILIGEGSVQSQEGNECIPTA